ncbi:DMT family transporter [Neorhizobium alkalisoli]|uniref:Transporter family-2 protein n=1 Tax=Neorhizobium alkalisoli TaxID=528178 RepID=A0A561R966_9HYPH|nr:DMT family transporter [Neorhizobium alkalisoli]TWF59148.1 transporter family-2 protein [Neorhizobium alkalisoli]
MNLQFLLVVLAAIAAGAAQGTQAVYNAAIAKAIGGVLPAALISMLVAAAILFTIMLVRQTAFPSFAVLQANAPYPLFIGGACGAIILMGVLTSVPVLGSAAVIVLFIFGQLAASITLDHFGAIGLVQHPVSVLRLVGLACVLAGAVLVIKG